MNMKLDNYTNTITTKYNTTEKSTKQGKNSVDTTTENIADDTAVVYEKSTDTVQSTKSNTDIINQLKFDVEQRTNQLHSLVQKMFNKQGITFNTSEEMFNILRTGQFTADPETIAQAKKDISEDGYWGVKQTSERMISFAKALSGNDPTQADKMIDAIKKGYEQATKTWGGELPDICKQTLDTTISQLEAWRDSIDSNDDLKTQEV